MSLFRTIGESSFVQTRLGRFEFYRRWYGGIWERHWIDICTAYIWLPMKPDRCWPDYRQPCSIGEPQIEDWGSKA